MYYVKKDDASAERNHVNLSELTRSIVYLKNKMIDSGLTSYGLPPRMVCNQYLKYINLIDENNSLATARELLDSGDNANILIAAEILANLKIKK